MKTEITSSKFLRNLATRASLMNGLCGVVALIAFSSPSLASGNPQNVTDPRQFRSANTHQQTWLNAQAKLPRQRAIDPYWTPCDNSSSSYADRCD